MTTQKFVLITTERTGSNYLCELLNRHSHINMHRELFHPQFIYWSNKYDDLNRSEEEKQRIQARDANPLRFVNAAYQQNQRANTVGFKLFIHHNEQILQHLIDDPQVAKIILHRANILAKFSSHLIARDTGVWGTQKEHKTEYKLSWNEQEFIDYRQKIEVMYQHVDELLSTTDQTVLRLEYLNLKQEATLKQIFNFLGVAYEDTRDKVKLRRQNTNHIVERFREQEEVKAFLMANNLQHWTVENHPG